MNTETGRWFATILLQYNLRDPFLDRDAGLFYQGFKANGIDARFAVLGDPSLDSKPDLVLAPLSEMQNPQWWRSWKLDGVMLYSWALPRFTPVAAAIKNSGARLVLVLDTDGFVAPRVWPKMYLRNKYYREKESGVWFPAVRALLKSCLASVKQRHAGTLRHLEQADFLVVPSTPARERYARYLRWLNREDLASRLRTVPYPVSEQMAYDPSVPKSQHIVAVGGWNRLQKNANLLVKVLGVVLGLQPEWMAKVIGPGNEIIESLAKNLPPTVRDRLQTPGSIPNERLPRILQESKISVCTSYHESFHLATAEALCCGCSFVGDARISSMPFFAALGGTGTLACNLAHAHFVDALLTEIELWRGGFRNPETISATWTSLLHPKAVARKILQLS